MLKFQLHVLSTFSFVAMLFVTNVHLFTARNQDSIYYMVILTSLLLNLTIFSSTNILHTCNPGMVYERHMV